MKINEIKKIFFLNEKIDNCIDFTDRNGNKRKGLYEKLIIQKIYLLDNNKIYFDGSLVSGYQFLPLDFIELSIDVLKNFSLTSLFLDKIKDKINEIKLEVLVDK